MKHIGKQSQIQTQEVFNMLMDYNDLLTTEEACEVLRVGYNTLYRLLNTGQLRGYRCGRVWRIPKVAVVAFIADNARLDGKTCLIC